MVDTVATAETSLTSSSSSMIGTFVVLLLHSNCVVWERDTT